MEKLILVLGPHGAGKSTLGRELADICEASFYGAGDLICAEIARGTERGLDCKDLMDSGHSVPLEVSYGLLDEALTERHADVVILDGYPRYVDQVRLLEQVTRRPVDNLLVLDAPAEIRAHRIKNRLSCTKCCATYGPGYPSLDGRCRRCDVPLERRLMDKNASAIARRGAAWREDGDDIVNHYRGYATVSTIPSVGRVPEVVQLALDALGAT